MLKKFLTVLLLATVLCLLLTSCASSGGKDAETPKPAEENNTPTVEPSESLTPNDTTNVPEEHVHVWNEGVVTTEPTCAEAGVKTFTCSGCDESKTEALSALGHDDVAAVTEPTCTEEGYTTHTCSRCGDSYIEARTAAKGHTWNVGAVTKEATEDEDGEITYACKSCGAVLTESIPSYAFLRAKESFLSRALELYPKAAWDESLLESKTAYEAVQAKREKIIAFLAEYDALLESIREHLTNCYEEYEQGHLDMAVLAEARAVCETVIMWRTILTDVTYFIAVNDSTLAIMEPPTDYKPWVIEDYSEAALFVTFGKYIDGHEDLVEYMVKIILHAEPDLTEIDEAYEEALEAYQTAIRDLDGVFRLYSVWSYADIDMLDALIADLSAFLATRGETYFNLDVINEYTGKTVDLFSQIFNERIMAGYYRSIVRAQEYAQLKGVDLTSETAGAFGSTNWVEYAVNTVDRYEESDRTFTSVAEGIAAVKGTWKSSAVDYEWAVMAINNAAGSEVANYEEFIWYLQTGELPEVQGE